MTWTTPKDLKKQLDRYWSDGRLLTAELRGETLFPLSLALRKPAAVDLSLRFDEVRAWIKELESASKERLGYGYEIGWATRNHRQLGRNRIPDRIVVSTESDALRLLDKSVQAECFYQQLATSLERFPKLSSWFTRRPSLALAYGDDWHRILDVLAWLCANPKSGLYLRQVEISGIDTKFIEDRRGLFSELLDVVSSPRCSGANGRESKRIRAALRIAFEAFPGAFSLLRREALHTRVIGLSCSGF